MSPPTASSPEDADLRRTPLWIGRVALWLVTALLLSLALAVLVSGLWLATPLGRYVWLGRTMMFAIAVCLVLGVTLVFHLFVVVRIGLTRRDFSYRSLAGARVHVGLTAWNDEAAIGDAVRDFKACGAAHEVIVVDNNSSDHTAEVAKAAGADRVVIEERPGYGSCCQRALAEAARGADVVVLCEGDMTFSGADIPKFLAYLENCDIVLGTRATQELRETDTQMDWLINPANQIVAKLVQTRFWGTRLTDMGCTYRAMRVDAYQRLAPHLHVMGNHFSPHMFIEALKLGMRVIEIPVVFRQRVGLSKGVGSNKLKAARVAWKMLGLVFRA